MMVAEMVEGSTTTGNVENETDRIRVLLIEDYVLLRQTFRSVLAGEDDIVVVADTGDHKDASKLVAEMRPDVVIIDIAARELGKLEIIRQIKEVCPNTKTLLLIAPDYYDIILGALLAGATGCLTKSTSANQFVQAVRAIAAGHIVLSSSVAEELLKHATWHPITTVPLDAGEKLSPRELDVIKLVALGMGNKDIGKALGLSPCTIKRYLADIYPKLGVRTRTEAVIIGLQAGFLSLDDLGYRKTEVMSWMSL